MGASMPLTSRVAIVTGAAKPDSIGHAVALGLAREGADVVVADLYEAGFAEVTRAIKALARRARCIRTDVADAASATSVRMHRARRPSALIARVTSVNPAS